MTTNVTQVTYPAKMLILVEGKRKIFHDMNKMKEYISGKPNLQRILETIQKAEERSSYPQAPGKGNY